MALLHYLLAADSRSMHSEPISLSGGPVVFDHWVGCMYMMSCAVNIYVCYCTEWRKRQREESDFLFMYLMYTYVVWFINCSSIIHVVWFYVLVTMDGLVIASISKKFLCCLYAGLFFRVDLVLLVWSHCIIASRSHFYWKHGLRVLFGILWNDLDCSNLWALVRSWSVSSLGNWPFGFWLLYSNVSLWSFGILKPLSLWMFQLQFLFLYTALSTRLSW